MKDKERGVESICHEARQIGDPAERDAYLAEVCSGDDSLRARVEKLLAAEAELGSPLPNSDETLKAHSRARSSTPSAETTVTTPLAEKPGEVIGRYKLLQQIGEGGMGTVYMADQREPVKRRVALKIIKLGMDTKQVIARFEAERQALAMMDHPNIAKVLDAGSTETGRPYFVMEYIKGVPILEYCDTDKLDTKARLELFNQVCHAIQHAHQKGIIHRDIKPSNVLITMHDGVPVPKVIDFGIAKATSAELTAKTLFTEHRQMIGTAAYMSPEQAEMSGLDIDTRSDIYSLGVLLYELLTGTTPFDSKELTSKGFAEMMRIIREVEPHNPSTRVSSLGDTGTRTAQQRRAVDPKKLSQTLKGDLDWIVMKCLEKDRTRRYETANGLAADIKRHLNDEPITAGAPSAGYKLRKFVKRNRPQVIAGGIVAAALLIGVIGTTWGMVWAVRERDRARESAKEALTAAEQTRRTSRFLTTMLASADPHESGNPTMTVRELLDEAAMKAEAELGDQPEVQADVYSAIGMAKRHLGQTRAAEQHLRKALEIRERTFGAEHALVAESRYNLAWALHDLPDYPQAERECRAALEMRRRVLGDDHPAVAECLAMLGDLTRHTGDLNAAETYFDEALRIFRAKTGDDDPRTLDALNDLALVYEAQSRFNEAETVLRRVVETQRRVSGESHPTTLTSMGNLAQIVGLKLGRLDEGEAIIREALAKDRELYPNGNRYTAWNLSILAHMLKSRGNLEEAEQITRESLEMTRKVFGSDHIEVTWRMGDLAHALELQGKLAEAETFRRDALTLTRELLTDENEQTMWRTQDLAQNLLRQQKTDEAEKLCRDRLAIARKIRGPEHRDVASALVTLARVLKERGDLAGAATHYRDALRIQRRTLPEGDASIGSTLILLGQTLIAQEKFVEAESKLRECLEIRRKALPGDHWLLPNAASTLGETIAGQGRFSEAEPLLLDSFATLESRADAIPGAVRDVRLREAIQRIVKLYEAWHAAEPDKGYDAKAAEWEAKLDAAAP